MLFEKLANKYPDNSFWKILAIRKVRLVIALLFWIIFILFVIFAVVKPAQKYIDESNKNKPKEEIKEEEQNINYLDEIKTKLNAKNFNYHYEITINEQKAKYNGSMLNDEESGYVENQNGISKYYINPEGFYNVINGQLVMMSKDELFNTYLNIDYILDIIEQNEVIKEDNSYIFQNDIIYGKMNLDNNVITIEINENGNNYLLEYTNFGGISKIDY